MMKNKNNPWQELEKEHKKRILEINDINLYWAIDSYDNYVLLFEFKNKIEKRTEFKLKEIDIKISNKELGIFLVDNEKWEVFKILCDDLINTIIGIKNESEIFRMIFKRLEEWKILFMKKIQQEFSLEEQMGLFTELCFLEESVIPKIGVIDAFESWHGPEKDIQDFLFSNLAIEVKSCITSKGKIATISNGYQLHTEKSQLILVHYSLTNNSKGENIVKKIENIEKMLKTETEKIIFNKKLIEFNLFQIKKQEENLIKFIIDKKNHYIVKDEFPKIDQKNLDNRISNLKYSINLELCDEFLIDELEVLYKI